MPISERSSIVARRFALIAAAAAAILILCACGSSRHTSTAKQARIVPGGCGETRLRHGLPPQWAMPAFAGSSSAIGTFAVGVHRKALAYFAHLRAGHPTNPANKILWIVHPPRGLDLVIRAHPLAAAHPLITVRRPADSSPGPIYPSYVDVPRAGCWAITLRWSGDIDSFDLAYARDQTSRRGAEVENRPGHSCRSMRRTQSAGSDRKHDPVAVEKLVRPLLLSRPTSALVGDFCSGPAAGAEQQTGARQG